MFPYLIEKGRSANVNKRHVELCAMSPLFHSSANQFSLTRYGYDRKPISLVCEHLGSLTLGGLSHIPQSFSANSFSHTAVTVL
jgi:hypothetical protein